MKYFLLNPVLKASGIAREDSTFCRLKKLGDNTGNMVFVNAIKEQIFFEKEDWLREDMDFDDSYTYVLPCSNFLHFSNHWIEPLTDIIEKHPIKIVLVGLGTQAELNEGTQNVVKRLSKKQKRFFQVIAERCTSIGVRGEFTAECLEKIGVKNNKVIGCPSAYKYLDEGFPIMTTPSFEKTIVTITPSRNKLSSDILNIGMKKNSEWIMQTKDEIVSLYSNNRILKNIQMEIRFPKIQWEDMVKYQSQKSKIFWNFEEWNEYIENGHYTFAFGTRFHGNMMALRNNVPTLWFIHDMRTWELVDTLKVPGIICKNNLATETELLENCDYSEFYKNYLDNAKKYINFLAENDIELGA